jgi:hypothetical protein
VTDRRPLLSPEDYQLSMRVSRPARRPEDNQGLRSMIVHRLLEGPKAVLRFALRTGQASVHCEPCGVWTSVDDVLDVWQCPRCLREYEAEFVIYSEVVPE